MRLTEILRPDCLKVPLLATTKQEAVYELIDFLADRIGLAQRKELKDAVWQRETTRTTGIGHGVAIPHGKAPGIQQLCMAIGKTATPIEFNSIDRRPVELIILLVSPPDQTGPHIQALARISRLLTDDKLRAAIKRVASADEAYQLIMQHESTNGNAA